MEKVCEQYEKERDRYKKKMNETDDEKKKENTRLYIINIRMIYIN